MRVFSPRVNRANVTPPSSSLIALITSCINILVLTLMHGRQLGWVCLGSCSTDVSFTVARIAPELMSNRLSAGRGERTGVILGD